MPAKVLSRDIYLGSIPWVILQLMLVLIVIFFPQTVTVFLDKKVEIDVNTIKIELPTNDLNQGEEQNDDQMNSLIENMSKGGK